jgi:chlorophyllide a reductase subunit Y
VLEGDGLGCHSGATRCWRRAGAGKSETLAQYAPTIRSTPKGPHDQPQSMCPAFGSLRVGLRMRRTATILSGSACCVYGLTFTSHFYGARRSVGYVPFNSETLVTGKLFEDIRDAVHRRPTRRSYDAIVIINLCVPTASGVPLQLLPKQINGVRIIGIDVPGFGVPTHAEAKDVLAGAMLQVRPHRSRGRPGAAPRWGRQPTSPPSRCWARCSRPTRWIIGMMLEPMGLAAGPVVPTREWRELYAALDCAAVAAIHPFYTASVREFEAAGRPSSARPRWATTAPRPGCRPSASACQRAAGKIDAAKNRFLPAIKGCAGAHADQGPHHAVAATKARTAGGRLLVESGADVRYVGTACPRTPWSDADREWLEARGVHVQYRASAWSRTWPRCANSSPTWPSAPRRWCRPPSRRAFRRCTSPT